MLSATLLSTSACSFHFDVRTAAILNPQEHPGPDGKPISEVMPFLVLQLKSVGRDKRQDLLARLDWQLLRNNWDSYVQTGHYPEPLNGYLSVPAQIIKEERPQESFTIAPGEHLRDVKISRLWTTRHLLIVARGAQKGTSSVLFLSPPLHQCHFQLCMKGYDVKVIPGGSSETCE